MDLSAAVIPPFIGTLYILATWEEDAIGQPRRGIGGRAEGEASGTKLPQPTTRPMGGKGEPQVDVRPSLGYEEGKGDEIRVAADDDQREARMILTGTDSHGGDGHVGALFLPNPRTIDLS